MKTRLKNLAKVTPKEKKRYVLGEARDYVILTKAKFLESQKLSKADRVLVRLLRTQLERDWRKPLITFINRLLKKYQ